MTKKGWIVLIAVAAFLITATGLIYWRSTHVARPKYVIAKKRMIVPTAVAKKKIAAGVAITKKFAHPKIAIVMDDFGYNMSNIDALFRIKEPITLSILPNLPYSRKIAELATSHGYEVILHLPLESHRKDVREEFDTIRSGMSEKEVLARLDEEIGCVPGLSGVSNHMGSKSTEDKELMTVILKHLAKKNLYFSDSLTSEKSICGEVARATGTRYAKRNMFLDNLSAFSYLEGQLSEMKELAFKRGRLIAICHDRKNTIAILSKYMPKMVGEGIEFVSLSKLVK